jgi:hypothetical protein
MNLLKPLLSPLLGLFFYVVISPVGWVLRLFGIDLLKKNIASDATTYWEDCP